MKKTVKPSIVPTLLSSRTLVWSAWLVLLFLALLALYLARSEAVRRAADYARPVSTCVEGDGFSVTMPPGWRAYSRQPGVVRIYKRETQGVPLVECVCERSEKYRYRALDFNPALIIRKLVAELSQEPDVEVPRSAIVLHGRELVPVRPGVPAVRFGFAADRYIGGGLHFILNDCSYFIWSLCEREDHESHAELRGFFMRTIDSLDLPGEPGDYDRPIVHSGKLTAERTQTVLAEAAREFAMWRLFEKRAEAEPAAALLPALQHFRETVRLLASVRQEGAMIASDDYRRYVALMEIRRRTLREWFVLLDKYRAMGDLEAARRQAVYIRDHATLGGEATDVRRASDILGELR